MLRRIARTTHHVARLFQKSSRDEQGSVAIEFGLTFLPIIVLISVIFEGGRLLFTQGVLNYAAQQATRFAVVNFSADVAAAMQAEAEDHLFFIDKNDVVVSACVGGAEDNRQVVALVNYTFNSLLLVPIDLQQMVGSSIGFRLLDAETSGGEEPLPGCTTDEEET